MAGMIPGVECARRRRFHQSSGGGGMPDSPRGSPARRCSFSLYVRNYKPVINSTPPPFGQRSQLSEEYCVENLGDAARQAKGRLDERFLRDQPKSVLITKRVPVLGKQQQECGNLQQNKGNTVGMKKNGSKRFSWAKLKWKSMEQEECSVCLEQLNEGEPLINLPCAHRFHYKCVMPWLHNNSHCPCCRLEL